MESKVLDERVALVTGGTTGIGFGADIVSGPAYGAIAEEMVDMETFAHLRAAQRFGVPLIGLRGISDGAEALEGLSDWTRHLQLIGSREVWVLKRLRCAGEEPIMLETSHLPQHRVSRIEQADLENRSLYDYLEQKHGILVTRAKEIFEPVLIRDYESRYLRVPEGYPALLLDRIAYDSQGRPVEFCRSIVRGDRCRFYTELL